MLVRSAPGNRASQFVGPCAALLAACALVLWLCRGDPPAAPRAKQASPAADLRGNGESLGNDVAPIRDAATAGPQPRSVRVRVLSADGAAVPAAVLLAHAPTAAPTRTHDAANAALLGATDREGRLLVPRSLILGRTLTAQAAGYRTAEASVALENQDDEVVLRLHPGSTLVIQCRTQDGAPLRGVRIAASAAPIERAWILTPPTTGSMPSGNAEVSLHEAESDALGRMTFSGLPKGRLFLSCRNAGHVVVDSVPKGFPRHEIVASTSTLDLTFDPVYCALGVLVDDTLLAWGAEYPAGLRLTPNLVDPLALLREHWETRLGAVICASGVPVFSAGMYQAPPDSLDVEMFTEKRGFTTARVPLRRLTEYERGPQEIRLGGPTGSGSRVSIVIATPSGRTFAAHPYLTLRPLRGGRVTRMNVVLPERSQFVLPRGEYLVSSRLPFLRTALPKEPITVAADGPVIVPIPFEPAPCRLVAHYSSGIAVDGGELVLEGDGRSVQYVATHGLAASVFLLPCGQLKVKIVGQTGERAEVEVVIGKSSDVTDLLLGTLR